MPAKKTQRRPNRARNRAPRPSATPVQPDAGGPAAAPVATPAAAPATPAARQVARTVGAPSARTLARRPQVTAINYAYLRNDLRTLAILAPAMVILVILAFLFIH